MKRRLILVALFSTILVGLDQWVVADTTPLDDFVAEVDWNYRYVHTETRHGWGYSVHALTMTSQQWRSLEEVDRVLWEHDLLVAVPWFLHSGNQNSAILIVNGGSNNGEPGTENDELMGLLAGVTGSVVAMVSQVPNQPLYFTDEAGAREEDALLAYGMDKYLMTGDSKWLVHLPMTKAVVRALDTVQEFAQSSRAIQLWPTLPRIDDAVVVGRSKRGWATWLTAAVEAQKDGASRVRAILPASIDLLNLGEQFAHHWETYGFFAPPIQDYVDFDLPCRVKTPAGEEMLRLIDPYNYRSRLTMPKLVLNSAGDQFFLPDSSRFYFADLPSPKRLRYTLNTDHSQGQDLPSIILPTLSWLSDVLDDKPGPDFSWSLEPDGWIQVQTYTEPERVRLWQATNPNARDFRLETIGAGWTSTELQDFGNGEYIGALDPPLDGWTAFTVEVTFPGSTVIPTPLESDQVFTTDVQVTPSTLPFAGTDPCGDRAPPAATLVSPSGAIYTGYPTYIWEPVSSATWYLLWVNDSAGISVIQNWYTAAEVGCGDGTCSVTPSTLVTGDNTWWILTYNDFGYGPWSAPMDFTVATTTPPPATLISPSGTIGTENPTYTWEAVSSATWYLLWVNDSAGISVIQNWYTTAEVGCGDGTCSVTPNTLVTGDNTWWILTYNDFGYGPWSAPMDFVAP